MIKGAVPIRSPVFAVAVATALTLAFSIIVIVLALSVPRLGVTFAPGEQGRTLEIEAVDPRGPLAGMPLPASLVAISAQGQRIALTPGDLVEDPDFIKEFADLDAFYARQTAITALLRTGPVQLELSRPGGTELRAAQPMRATLSDLGLAFWSQILTGALGFLLGVWVWALRPGEISARMFALAGVGMLFAFLGIPAYATRELALDGATINNLLRISSAGSWILGMGLTGLFLVYPTRLAGKRGLYVLLAFCVLGYLIRTFRLAPDNVLALQPASIAALLVLIGAIAVQWRASRKEPRSAVIIRWLGVSVGAGCAAFVVLVNLPLLLGASPLVSQSLALPAFLLIYAGVAVGVARYRLFELDAWAFKILFFLGGALALVGLDAALVFWLGLGSAPSFSLALLAIAILYLPLRDFLWRRISARRNLDRDELFKAVAETAFDRNGRAERWGALVSRLFDPLEVVHDQSPCPEPTITGEGLEMRLPSLGGAPALVLRHPWRGRGLFGQNDLRLAREIVAMLRSIEEGWDAYERGALTERRRIAQDLHDDVGARLLSALHGADGGIRPTLQAALEDIRSIISGLSGEERTLGRVAAEIRHEAANRLGAVDIDLDWPLLSQDDEDVALSYRAYRNLSSAAREIVSNVIRHASATQVSARLGRADGQVVFRLADNGVGLPPSAAGVTGRYGLKNLARRMQDLGGELAFPSAEKGLTVQLTFPVSDAPEQGVRREAT